MAVEITSVVEVECLFRNGRELFVMLELPRDTITEAEGLVTLTRRSELGVTEEHAIPRSEMAYMKHTTREVQPQREYRTLGKSAEVGSAI